jgi:hypothetical protein
MVFQALSLPLAALGAALKARDWAIEIVKRLGTAQGNSMPRHHVTDLGQALTGWVTIGQATFSTVPDAPSDANWNDALPRLEV